MNIAAAISFFMPIIISCGAGVLYGISFILQHRSIFAAGTAYHRAQTIAFFLMRVMIILGMFNYLLRTPLIPSILGSIGFFGMFWLIVLQVRAKPHE